MFSQNSVERRHRGVVGIGGWSRGTSYVSRIIQVTEWCWLTDTSGEK